MIPAAWHPDPTGKHELRYWDGGQWTEHVADQGVQGTDPLDVGPADSGEQAVAAQEMGEQVGPADDIGPDDATRLAPHRQELLSQLQQEHPETAAPEAVAQDDGTAEHTSVTDATPAPSGETPTEEPSTGLVSDPPGAGEPSPEAAPYQPAQAQPPAYQPDPYQQGQPPAYQQAQAGGAHAAVPGGISGDLIDGRYGETTSTAPGASLQNPKLLRVRLGEPFLARQGSMVAYQGPVDFQFQGGGAAKYLKKAVTGEGLSLMQVAGQGDVFIADTAKQVHLLQINNSGISINGDSVLAFSASLQWDIERVKGGSMAAGGLFNTTLRGTGWVAITTDGEPLVLNAAEAPTFADPQALVAWSVDLQTSVKSTVKASALIGRGSGEAFQVAFNGHGFVIVQPSEGYPAPAQ